MKRILMLTTGGTIASRPTALGLAPAQTAEDLLDSAPDVRELCSVEPRAVMNLDSTNMAPGDWLTLAACIRGAYDQYDGFVITHGTDTMAYTAGALTYLIQGSPKPIVLTGAQQSIWQRDTDARVNLLDAFRYAADDRSHGVVIVFDGKVITGARARKTHTKSFHAFSSIDFPELAVIRGGRILRYLPEIAPDGPRFYERLNPRVAALKLIPGIDAALVRHLLLTHDALVIEAFGVGGVPDSPGSSFVDALAAWRDAGKIVVVTTQVPHEGSDMGVYAVGGVVKGQAGVLEAYNMTFEAVVTKLMWILAETKDPVRAREMFHEPVAHDLLTFD